MASATNALLGLALGAGAGFAVWHFIKQDPKKPHGGGSGAPAAPAGRTSTVAAPAAGGPGPPRNIWPCLLRLDAAGLTANGERVELPAAVARCKTAGRAELAVTPDAPAAI